MQFFLVEPEAFAYCTIGVVTYVLTARCPEQKSFNSSTRIATSQGSSSLTISIVNESSASSYELQLPGTIYTSSPNFNEIYSPGVAICCRSTIYYVNFEETDPVAHCT